MFPWSEVAGIRMVSAATVRSSRRFHGSATFEPNRQPTHRTLVSLGLGIISGCGFEWGYLFAGGVGGRGVPAYEASCC
jgi:hypothetical protein